MEETKTVDACPRCNPQAMLLDGEALAYQKANALAVSLTDPASAALAAGIAQRHAARFSALYALWKEN